MAFATDAQRRWFFAHLSTGMRSIAGKMRESMGGKPTSEVGKPGKTLAAGFKRIPTVDPRKMTAGEINKALDKLDALDSAFTDEMIAAGRGHERFNEWVKLTDPLSARGRAIWERKMALRDEIAKRYGPGAPSRLPRGFGPIGR